MQLPDSLYESEKIVGVREFRLSITIANLSQPVLVDFIVSDSPTPPSWNSITDNPAKISRTFDNAANQKRKIYFSVTNEYQAKKGAIKVDLSTETSKEGEDKTSKRQAPGLMLPATDYYVHAYSKGLYVKTSQAITTVAYPTDPFPKQYNTVSTNKPFGNDPEYSNYAWRMQMWQEIISARDDDKFLQVAVQDLVYIPFRYLALIDQTPTVLTGRFAGRTTAPAICPDFTSNFAMLIERVAGDPTQNRFETEAFYWRGEFIKNIDGEILTNLTQHKANIAVFVSSPQLPAPESNRNQVLDAMIKVRYSEAPAVYYTMNINCPPPLTPIRGTPYYTIQYVNQ